MFDTMRMGASAAGAYEIERSLRFNASDSANLTRTSSGTSTTFTYSLWIKRSCNPSDYEYIFSMGNQGFSFHSTNDTFYLYDGSNLNESTAKFRDPSAWYHVVVQINSGVATSYINNAQVHNAVGSGFTLTTGSNETRIGSHASSNFYYNGYMTEIHLVDGSVVAPSSFGETNADTGQWIPKKYAGSHGTDGFYLNFSDNSNTTAGTLGADTSGNGNNFTPTNLGTVDSMVDTPSNNWCTLNPLNEDYASNGTFSEGNLKYDSTSANHRNTAGTIGMKSGKWYFEFCNPTLTDGSKSIWAGVVASDADLTAQRTTGMWHVGASSGRFLVRDGTATDFGSAIAADSVIQAAVDMDNSKLWIGINNTWYGSSSDDTDGNPSTGANPTDTIAAADIPDGYLYPSAGGYDLEIVFNAGQDSSFSGEKTAQGNTDGNGLGDFYYTPPTGFMALCTSNLPEPTILKGTDHFDTSLWAGNAGDQDITGLSFQPNMVWDKCRSTTHDWQRWDSVRGVEQALRQDGDPETEWDDGLVAFNSDGYSFGSNSRNNGSGHTYLGYAWKESASAGFDIVSYTGNGSARTISHSLGVAPEMIIIKCRSESQAWKVGHKHLSGNNWTYRLIFSDNSDQYDAADFNDTAPTSSVFSVGTDDTVNKDTATYIAYLFASVEGYSKIGSYEGNGDTDGPFLYCGFKPAWFMVKRIDADHNWHIIDSKRTTYNPTRYYIMANSNAQGLDSDGAVPFDFVSNGVKLRDDGNAANNSSGTYIYMAFAERPFKYANAR